MSTDLISEIKSILNPGQQDVFDECINGTQSVFCTGAGGTGKSMLLNCIVKYFRSVPQTSEGYIAVTASTGIAAFNIGGITLHRFAGTGIEEQNIGAMISRASKGQALLNWTNTSILIIDEISMVSPVFFANISFIASSIRGIDKPFGGIRVLMFGDFLQLPPVSKSINPMSGIFTTDAWNQMNVKVLQLKTVVRQSNARFQAALTEARYGICSPTSIEYFKSLEREISFDDGIEPIRLFAKRDITDTFNQSRLDQLAGNEFSLQSSDSGAAANLKQCPVPSLLKLKIGCQVMLVRNIGNQAVNGSIGTVVKFVSSEHGFRTKPMVKFTSFNGTTFDIIVNKYSWETIAPNGTIIAKRVQYPLVLAWAITIHKSQGQTIPRLHLDMSGIFETGQAYVALSRCPDPHSLRIENFDPRLIIASAAAVQFYQDIDSSSNIDDAPVYSTTDNDEPAPDYTEHDANRVANTTDTTWDNNRVQPRPLNTPTIETQIMLGNLRLHESPSP